MNALFKTSKSRLTAATLLIVLAFLSAPGRRTRVAAFASAQRTFVSGLGSDANPCTRGAPCRTFGQAISQTNAGGEVIVLDSAGYGPVAITQPVSIVAPPGVYAGISVLSGDGIDINVGPSDTVILRGLTINNQGSPGDGIHVNTGHTLHIESCVVNGFSNGFGIEFFGSNLEVKDSIVRGNQDGIHVYPSSGTALAAIDATRLEMNSSDGLTAREGSKVTVRNSTASGNGNAFVSFSLTSAPSELNIESCVVANNGVGVVAQSASTGVATARVSNCTITDNTQGLINSGAPALLLSRGNNSLEGNSTQTFGTIGSYTAK
jgi:hypothetical protein